MGKNTNKEYRVTWRHEVYFTAKDDIEARQIWEKTDTGSLDKDGGSCNDFIEEISFECVDDDYRDIN